MEEVKRTEVSGVSGQAVPRSNYTTSKKVSSYIGRSM